VLGCFQISNVVGVCHCLQMPRATAVALLACRNSVVLAALLPCQVLGHMCHTPRHCPCWLTALHPQLQSLRTGRA
jgi:hypothetical protein